MTEKRKAADGKEMAMELCKEQHHELGGLGPGISGFHDADELDEPFLCYICLEVVHKPVVNACGHMFCFWCVHRAMNTDTESYCPLCRNPYMHFPRVCEQLHFLLLKAVPEAYRSRCKEISGEFEEEEIMCSPQFSDGLNFLTSAEGGPNDQHALAVAALEGVSIDPTTQEASPQTGSKDEAAEASENTNVEGKSSDTSSSSSSLKTDSDSMDIARDIADATSDGPSSSFPYVTVSDLLCTGCEKLLFRPVVVNCGHVFCEGCVTSVEAEGETIIKCSSCGCIHPGGFPQVCLELNQYIEQNFHAEYTKRKEELSGKASERLKSRNSLNKELQKPDNLVKKELSSSKLSPRMHPGVGCDGCGMYPMFGRRFRCIDCPKLPGYDLCYHCFTYGSNLAGRFNQQHKPKHQIREVIGNPSVFPDYKETGEGSEGIDTYLGIVGYFA